MSRVEALARTMSVDEAKPLERTFGILRERMQSRPRAIAEIKAWLDRV